MKNCLFPAKLFALLAQAKKDNTWMKSQHRLDGMPVDGLTRIMLMTPEIHQAFDGEFPNEHTRLRLTISHSLNVATQYEECMVEVYSAEGMLLKQYKVADMSKEQALALQAELMYAVISSHGGFINSL